MKVFIWCDTSMEKRVAVAVANTLEEARASLLTDPRAADSLIVEGEPRAVMEAAVASTFFDD